MTYMRIRHPSPCGCDEAAVAGGLLTVDMAFATIDRAMAPVEAETLPLAEARGRTLAEPLTCTAMSPAFDNAAMDGYAVATRALDGPGPWTLAVEGLALAGQPPSRLARPDCAMRIMTGAPVPEGADAVVMQERVRRRGDRVILDLRPEPGAQIRRAGEDMDAGDVIVPAGRRLTPRAIAAGAAAGADHARVRRRIRVALIVTGDEVAGGAGSGGAIRDVNGPMLRAALSRPDVSLVEAVHAGDRLEHLAFTLSRLAASADLIVTSGGVSVGTADLVKPALRAAGGSVAFEGVAIKPGKPVSFGRIGAAVWLGLPGNPVAAFTTWSLFGVRILARLSGCTEEPRRRHAATAAPLHHTPGRCEFRPARIVGFDGQGRETIDCPPSTNSARVSDLASTDGFALIPADVETLPAGGLVEFVPFDGC